MRPGGVRATDWGSWLGGTVELHVRTTAPHRFVNALLEAGLGFRDARSQDGGLRVRVPLRAFRRLRPLVRGTGARVHIAGRGGLPFVLHRALRHKVLLAVALAAAVVLYVLSGYVWFVQVRGADRVAAASVVTAAARLGLRPGARRAAVDAARVGRELPLLLPEVSWAGVNLRGTLATIDVVERVRAAPAYEEATAPGDVVAADSGIVAAMTVLAGTPLVRPGDRVQRGQVLIAGEALLPVARSRTSGLQGVRLTPVHASGVVLVRRWYAAYAQQPRTVQVEVPTGRVYTRLALVLGGRRLFLAGWRPVPFSHYVLRRRASGPLRWRNLPLPVETLVLRYLEVRRFVRRLSVDDAGALAAAEARTSLLPRLPPRARIVEERQRAVLLPGERVVVELLVESEENIGVFRPRPTERGDAAPAGTDAP